MAVASGDIWNLKELSHGGEGSTTTMVVTRGLGDDARSAMVVIFL